MSDSLTRILIVDDEPVVRDLVTTVLEGPGRVVRSASNLAEALGTGSDERIDVAIVERHLSGHSGIDVVRQIKARDSMTGIIITSVNPSLRWVMEAIEIGASDYLSKPFRDIHQVAFRVEKVEEQVRLQRERSALVTALRESEERYRKLFDASPDPVIVVDAETKLVQAVNAAALRLYGQPEVEVLGRHARVFIGDLVDEKGSHEEVLRARRLRHLCKDGREVEVEVSSGQFRLDARPMIVHVMRDVTERTRQEAERSRLQEQLRQAQKMEALGLLAGGISHDFNNSLAVILNYATFIAEGLRGDVVEDMGEMRRDVEQILQAATSASAVTRQLLAFSRQDIVRREVVEPSEVIGAISKLLKKTLGPEVAMETRLAADSGRVKVDRAQLEQMLVNLVINAKDALRAGGKVTLEVRASPDDEDCAQILVSDTGEGIPEEHLTRIFEPFFTTKAPGEGTGLGLATVRGFVEQAGGKIEVASELGQGTTFTISLPRTYEDLTKQRPPTTEPVGTGETILVVDDDDAVRRAACRILRRAGYRVLEARCGRDALTLLAAGERADLLLTDLMMPGMSGIELSDRVARTYPGLPFAYMTGYATDEVVQRAKASNEDILLQKPFRDDRLRAFVLNRLAQHAHRRSTTRFRGTETA